jgi:hypothetical protein
VGPTSTDDRAFEYGSIAAAALIAALLFGWRFCSSVPMPPKPAAPRLDTANARDVLASADATPESYKAFVENDAEKFGVPAPSMEAMGKVLVPRSDDGHLSLSPGDPPRDIAGLRLSVAVERGDRGDDLVLVIDNPGEKDLAYDVVTSPSYGTSACNQRSVISFNALVVGKHGEEKRSECVYRSGMVLGIDHVETLELNGLESIYVSRVPPQAVGLELRLAQGHRPSLPSGVGMCNVSMSQSIRAGIENGAITWRDLVDFYARHRCDTYSFPDDYRAFTKDDQRKLPAVSGGG